MLDVVSADLGNQTLDALLRCVEVVRHRIPTLDTESWFTNREMHRDGGSWDSYSGYEIPHASTDVLPHTTKLTGQRNRGHPILSDLESLKDSLEVPYNPEVQQL